MPRQDTDALSEDRKMAKMKLYSTPTCTRCAMLESELPEDIEVLDMSRPEVLTELRCSGIFTLQAPILQIDEDFYTVEDLFKNEMVNVVKVRRLLQRYGLC